MRLLGRREALAAIQMKLAEQNFVTIVGPGGIGKTTVAVTVAHEMSTTFNSQIYFVDLSALAAIRSSRQPWPQHSACRYKQTMSCQP
jgi:ABC-type nitrate/sulfonate/bicarbonate transport system ATPase subunit